MKLKAIYSFTRFISFILKNCVLIFWTKCTAIEDTHNTCFEGKKFKLQIISFDSIDSFLNLGKNMLYNILCQHFQVITFNTLFSVR